MVEAVNVNQIASSDVLELDKLNIGKHLFSSVEIDSLDSLPVLKEHDLWSVEYDGKFPLIHLNDNYLDSLYKWSNEHPVVISAYEVMHDLDIGDSAQGWSYPVSHEAEDSGYNIMLYPDTVEKNLTFLGAIVVSKWNNAGFKRVEYCFDDEYRLDYVKNNSQLKDIFDVN